MNKSNYAISEGQLFQPFFNRGDGECPYCGKPIIVIQSEVSTTALSKEGAPILYDTDYYKIYGYCENCDSKIPVVKRGFNFVATENAKTKDAIDRVFGRLEKFKEESDIDNPFGYYGGYDNERYII